MFIIHARKAKTETDRAEKQEKGNRNRKSNRQSSPARIGDLCLHNRQLWKHERMGWGVVFNSKGQDGTQKPLPLFSSLSCTTWHFPALPLYPWLLLACRCNSPLHLFDRTCPPDEQKKAKPRRCARASSFKKGESYEIAPPGCSSTAGWFIIPYWTRHVKGFSETGDFFFWKGSEAKNKDRAATQSLLRWFFHGECQLVISPRKNIITQLGEKCNSFPETRLEKFYRSLCVPLTSCNRLCWILDAGSVFLPALHFRFIAARFMALWTRVALCFGLFGVG